MQPSLCLLTNLTLALLCVAPAMANAGSPAGAGGYTEEGQATWYGPRHEGQRTTSGEAFDSGKLTAAHPSLPMGSYVRVTMQQTGRSIVVRVNDREPPHGVRCIDLSRAAAARLGFLGRGVADVTLAQVDTPDANEELAEAPDTGAPASPRAIVRHGRRHTHRARR